MAACYPRYTATIMQHVRCRDPCCLSIVVAAAFGNSRTMTWLHRLWAWLRAPERCPECGLTRRKADLVRCPCDWRDGRDI